MNTSKRLNPNLLCKKLLHRKEAQEENLKSIQRLRTGFNNMLNLGANTTWTWTKILIVQPNWLIS